MAVEIYNIFKLFILRTLTTHLKQRIMLLTLSTSFNGVFELGKTETSTLQYYILTAIITHYMKALIAESTRIISTIRMST